MDNERNHQHKASSPSLIDVTIATKRQQLIGTLTSPSLPTRPFDLIPEILCRLRAKLLVQFQCVCKSWNSLISDTKFTKKQLRVSTVSLVHTLTYSVDKYVLKSYPLDSIFANVTANPIAQLEFLLNPVVFFIGSCNGILCFLAKDSNGFLSFRLLNPSIRKFKELPPLQKPQTHYLQLYGFIHDPITDNYMVVVVLHVRGRSSSFVDNHEVKVHCLGTNYWKSIQTFPFDCVALQSFGKFVSGTINWLVAKKYDNKIQHCIVSLDLKNESYKEVFMPPDYAPVNGYIHLHMSVLRDCLCMVINHDVWVMKEHGNKDSWTKLFTIPYMQDFPTSHATIKVVNTVEDDKVLLRSANGSKRNLIYYNSRYGTYKFTEFEFTLEVCLESLISP